MRCVTELVDSRCRQILPRIDESFQSHLLQPLWCVQVPLEHLLDLLHVHVGREGYDELRESSFVLSR